MDVKTTFLQGDLEEEISTKQPKGFIVKGKKELVRNQKTPCMGQSNHQICGIEKLIFIY